ncbi:MAG: hypothetical protein K0R77_1213 [Chryseobacterium sp.]|jgi:hypothetical protein|uniref:hypothetical protein n=1 Tax=Chryseobacterium sp. TaxID=1871047 RepID=UPI0026136FC1|nr:hypothetical protein [Chryseobacterium sp.]MDF2551938.1 hypothetical protein [Chryseobacterium sp.]
MEENEEFDSDFNTAEVPISEGFWNYMENYWHNNREFPESTESSLNKKADLVDGKVPSSQLPSYVDDVLEFDTFENLPNPGEKGKIYLVTNNNTQFRWSGSEYIQLNSDEYLMTTNTAQYITGRKEFITSSGNDSTNNSLFVTSNDGNYPAISFYRPRVDLGQLKYVNSDLGFYFVNSPNSTTIPVNALEFRKSGSNNDYVLLGGGSHKAITDFATTGDINGKVPYVGAMQDIHLNNKSIFYAQKLHAQGSIIHNNLGLSVLNDATGGYVSNPLIKIGAIAGNMITFTVKLYNYPYYYYEFQVNIYIYQNNVYEPRIIWRVGESGHIDRIEFFKDPNTGLFYIQPIITVGYPRLAITDVQGYGGDGTFFNENWSVVWGGDTTPLTLQGTINSVDFSGDSRVVNTHKTQEITARKVINKDLGTNEYIGVAQHNAQFQVGRTSDAKSLEFAVTDDGTSYIQSKEAGVGYHPLILNRNNNGGVSIGGTPVIGHGLTVNGSIYSVEGYHKEGADNNSVLLAGGGHKAISDFALTAHTHKSLLSDYTGTVDLNNLIENQKFNFNTVVAPTSTNIFPNAVDNANAVLSISTHPNYGVQLGFNTYGEIYTRGLGNGNWGGWNKLITGTDASNYVTVNTDQTIIADKTFAHTSNVTFLGGENNHIVVHRNSSSINAIASGHTYSFYDTIWKVGNKRGDSSNSLGYAFQFSGNGGTSYQDESVLIQADGNILSSNFGAASQWNQAYNWGNHATVGYLTNTSLNGYATQEWVSANFPNQTLSTGLEGLGGQTLTLSNGNAVTITNNFVTSPDGTRNPDDVKPNTSGNRVRFDFANASSIKGSGNYAGVMTYAPWDGTTASTGDSSYQLAFANQTGIDGEGVPMLKLRKGIDDNWTSDWYKMWSEGDFSQSDINNWNHIANTAATQSWVQSQNYSTHSFVEESLNQLTAEHTNPDYPILAERKFTTVIITEEYHREHIDFDSILIPERQLTVTNLAPFDIDVRREDNSIDRILSGETTEYYITVEKRFIKKGSYRRASFLN